MTWILFSRSMRPLSSPSPFSPSPCPLPLGGGEGERDHFPIHFMSRSTETSRICTILPPLTMTSRARLVGRWSSLVYVNGGVRPQVSKSFRVYIAFLTDSPVGDGPARLIASTVMITHSHPRM